MCDGEGSPDPRQRPPGTPAPAPRRPSDRASGRRAAPAADPAPGSSGYATATPSLPRSRRIQHSSSGAVGRRPGRTAWRSRADDNPYPAGRATAAARRTARGVQPRLRSHELLLDASQELLTLGQGQAQGGQIREVVRSGDPHDLRAAFVPRGPDAYQLHDPGHAVSAHRSTSRKVPSWTRTPNLAAVPYESAGKQKSERARKGNVHLRTILVGAAISASRTKGSY